MIKIICDVCSALLNQRDNDISPVGYAVRGGIHMLNNNGVNGMGGGILGSTDSDRVFHYCKVCLKKKLDLDD